MLSFECDYIEGCHEEVLRALVRTNLCQEPGYGSDSYCASAIEKIRAAISCPDAEIYFLHGGTQTNQLAISTMLRPYEGVLAAETGHVSGHEAGAIEFSGHKVLVLPSHNGKVLAEDVEAYMEGFCADRNRAHMVFPGMLYISHPTEYGTLYSREELQTLSALCRARGLHLYLDGARLGYGLEAPGTDVTLADIAALTDAFYIGGTKVGALCGEALVFPKHNAPPHFLTQIKQHGALTAKGRLYGVQFEALFTDGLYNRISRHAIEMAQRLRELFADFGLPLYIDSPTNQQFVILDNELRAALQKEVRIGYWEALDSDHAVMRFATSWATKPESIDTLRDIFERLLGTQKTEHHR